jgi:F-type H+-transporting ATPase subunit epsilon
MASLDVHLVTPEREVYAGAATMVVARAVDGDVGILPGHVPMLVPLAIGVLVIHGEAGTRRAAVDGGFLHVTDAGDDTRIDVLAERAELEEEIDVEAARRREQELRGIAEEDAGAKAELAKALVRLSLRG